MIKIKQIELESAAALWALDESGCLWLLNNGKWSAYKNPGESDYELQIRGKSLDDAFKESTSDVPPSTSGRPYTP